MKSFVVSITETSSGAVIVEAADEAEAEKIGMDMYMNGEVHWTDSEINKIDATLISK